MTPRDDIRPADIVALNATSVVQWRRCRREYRIARMLGIPASDEGPSPDLGVAVHAMLRQVHETGTRSCRDAAHVTDVLGAHGFDGDGPMPAYVERHARRCPVGVDWSAHELDVARFHRRPAPMFMATGRIDAVWVHDGIADARDYKTGAPPASEHLRDDPRARLQAWLLAPRAARKGLRVRVRYEFLAPEVTDDPVPFEPDDDELAEIEEELRGIVAEVWQEQDYAGIADAVVCGWCRYRSICRDSAAPAVPAWPVPPDVDD